MNALSIIKKPVCKLRCLDVHLLEIVFYTFKLNFYFLQHNLTSHLNCLPHLFVCRLFFLHLKRQYFFFSSNVSLELLHYFSCSWLSFRKKKIAPDFLIRIPRNKRENTASFLDLSIFHCEPSS